MTGDGKALELSTELAACCLYLKSFCPTCRTQQGQQCTMCPERIGCQACETRRRCTDCSILPCTECNMAPSTAKRCTRCHLRELLSRLRLAVTSSCSTTTFHPTAHAVPLCAPPASGTRSAPCQLTTHLLSTPFLPTLVVKCAQHSVRCGVAPGVPGLSQLTSKCHKSWCTKCIAEQAPYIIGTRNAMKHMYNDGPESNPRMEKCFKCGFSMSPFRGHSSGFGVPLLPRSTVALNNPTFFNIKLCSSLTVTVPSLRYLQRPLGLV